MRKTLMGFALSLITMSLSAQQLNKKYDLFYLDKHSYAYYIGAYLRNDTIFITPGAIINVISIQNEDSTWRSILLKPYREPSVKYEIPSHGTPTTKYTNTLKLEATPSKSDSIKPLKKQ